jgi:hypothetical protein
MEPDPRYGIFMIVHHLVPPVAGPYEVLRATVDDAGERPQPVRNANHRRAVIATATRLLQRLARRLRPTRHEGPADGPSLRPPREPSLQGCR